MKCYFICSSCIMCSSLQKQSRGWSDGIQAQAMTQTLAVIIAQIVWMFEVTVTWLTNTDIRRREFHVHTKCTGVTIICCFLYLFWLAVEPFSCQLTHWASEDGSARLVIVISGWRIFMFVNVECIWNSGRETEEKKLLGTCRCRKESILFCKETGC